MRMNRLTLRFADVGLEQAFREEQARKTLKPVRAAMVAVAVVILVIWALLQYILPHVADAQRRFAAPMLAMLALLAYGYGRSYMESFLRMQQFVLLVGAWGLAMALVGICSLMPRTSLDATGLVIVAIHTLNVYGILRLRFPGACYAGWGTAMIYLGYLSHTGALGGTELVRHATILLSANLFGMIAAYQFDQAARREFLAMRMVGQEREHSERLLLNILPAHVIQELGATGKVKPARHEDASILFTDFASFTQATSTMPADRMVAELNDIFVAFDEIAHEEGVEKIKTIGDAYMAAAGLSDRAPNHAERCVRAALRMTKFMEERNRTAAFKWRLRVGIHSGPVVSGVVGKRKYAFDIWGDAVNIASRMESSGEVGEVNISAYTYDLIRSMYPCTYRGKINAKGKGEVDMYFVDTTRSGISS